MPEPQTVAPPWSVDKLAMLEKYLHAYSVIMASQVRKGWFAGYSYVDAFAGTGRYVAAEQRAYVDGSPLVALRCDPPFGSLAFIEKSRGRLTRLRQVVATDFPKRRVHFFKGDANEQLRRHVLTAVTKQARRRALVFLDPYGLEVDFDTVAELGRAGTFDIFVNFSTMGITRLLRRRELPGPEATAILRRVMGDTTWIDRYYETRIDLFNEAVSRRGRIDPLDLFVDYATRLKPFYRHISEPLAMRNAKNVPLYVLFVASQKEPGIKIVNQTFSRFERVKAAVG